MIECKECVFSNKICGCDFHSHLVNDRNGTESCSYFRAKIKIITIVGSVKKFKDEMINFSQFFSLAGHLVFMPILFNENYKDFNKHLVYILFKEKIKLSDEIFVVNLNNYIGEDTKKDIEYAKLLGKPIHYAYVI